MLSDAPVAAFLPVTDLERARKFYEGVLGLAGSETPEGIMYQSGQGTMLSIYVRGAPTKADHSVAGWRVEDAVATVTALGTAGVVFEQYDMPGIKTDERGIAEIDDAKGAWFKDPDGNILAVFEMP